MISLRYGKMFHQCLFPIMLSTIAYSLQHSSKCKEASIKGNSLECLGFQSALLSPAALQVTDGVQGLPEEAAKTLREEFLAKAEAMFPVRSRGRKPAAAIAGLGVYCFQCPALPCNHKYSSPRAAAWAGILGCEWQCIPTAQPFCTPCPRFAGMPMQAQESRPEKRLSEAVHVRSAFG